MQTETVEYKKDGWDVSVVVSQATILMGTRRTRLMIEAVEEEEEGDFDLDLRLLRRFVYPVCIAATIKAVGIPWPLAFKDDDADMDFVRLPDQFGQAWEAAVTGLNPHWSPQDRSKKE